MIIAFISLAEEEPIGILRENKVYCSDCGSKESGCNIYRTNISPYKQTCASCKKLLVEGRTELWPELFAQ